MSVISIKQLLEAGVHFGHHTRRWNPKMAEYIFTERNGIYIIDLQKTAKKFEEAYMYARDLSANGGTILFVGTKKQATDAIRDEALRCGTSLRHVLCKRTLARRYAYKLPNHQKEHCSSCTIKENARGWHI